MEKIIRKTIFTFLKNYQSVTTKPIFLLLPFSASILFFQSLLQSSSLVLPLLCLIISTFPLIMAKSSILTTLNPQTPPLQSKSISLLLKIQTLNMGFLITLSAASKSLTLVLNSYNPFLEIVFGALYYTVCTNTSTIFNLAFVLSITGNIDSIGAISDAFSLRIRESRRILLLSLPPSLGFAAIEALFRHRVVRAMRSCYGRTLLSITLEGLFVSYLYSTIVVLDTIACFLFIKDCESCSIEQISEDLP